MTPRYLSLTNNVELEPGTADGAEEIVQEYNRGGEYRVDFSYFGSWTSFDGRPREIASISVRDFDPDSYDKVEKLLRGLGERMMCRGKRLRD
jgi:hypothetical protein